MAEESSHTHQIHEDAKKLQPEKYEAHQEQPEGEAGLTPQVFQRADSPRPEKSASMFSRMGQVQRTQALLQMQHVHGNSYVQRFTGNHFTVQRENIMDMPYEKLHEHEAMKMDPKDAYLKPPLNWDGLLLPVVTPDAPQPDVRINRIAPGPPPIGMERLQWDSSNLLIPSGMYEKRLSGWTGLDQAAGTIESSWKAAAPLITSYNTAKDEIKQDGALGPAPVGENWMPVPGASSYDQLAGGQVLGSHTKLDDLFKGGAGGPKIDLSGVDADAGSKMTPDKKAAVSDALVAARAKDLDVKSALDKLNSHINTTLPSAAKSVKIAFLAAEITEQSEDLEVKKKAKEKLEEEKKQAGEKIELAVKLFKLIPESVESNSAKAEIVGILANQIIGGLYDQKIKEASSAVIDSDYRLKGLIKEQNIASIEKAKLDFKSAQDQVPILKRDIQKALNDRREAYHVAAQAAGKAAGGGEKGERIQAALEAIPRVQTVLGRVDAIRSKLVLPSYSDPSGVSYRAASEQAPGYFDTVNFVLYLNQLKMYKSMFEALHTEWDGRLTSLKKLEASFNVPGR